MPTYSLFWDRHYKDIGNCCMTQPLDHPILVNSPTGGGVDAVHEEKYVQMIDVAWMNSEKMKWIGWDKQGYYAWITPKGMIYLFKDLKRNEKGKEWEKEHGTMRLPDDGRTQSFWPTGRDFYEWEKEVQENCGFCNDSRATPTTESDKDEEGGSDIESDSEGLDLPAWKNLLDGGGLESRKKVTDTDDVSYTGFATDTSNIGYETYGAPYANGNDVDPNEYIGNHDASEYIGTNEYIGTYAPPPTTTPPPPAYTRPPRKQNPVVNTQKVLTAPQSPFQKILQERVKQFEQSIGKDILMQPDPIDNLRTKDPVKKQGEVTFPKKSTETLEPFKFHGNSKIPIPIHSYGSQTPVYVDPYYRYNKNQTLEYGRGDIQYQDYEIVLEANESDFEKFKNAFLKSPGSVTNNFFAEYDLKDGDANRRLTGGDIIDIDIRGPINGKVRVISVHSDNRIFATSFQPLLGHPEAGYITFTGKYVVGQDGRGNIVFTISNVTRQQLGLIQDIAGASYIASKVGRGAQKWQWEAVLKNVRNFLNRRVIKAEEKIRYRKWDLPNGKPGKWIVEHPKPVKLYI